MSGFDLAEARRLQGAVFADWIRELDLEVREIGPQSALLRLPFSERLCREGGVICGQALMAAADTAMVFAVAAASGGYRPMTTVDQTIHFLRPAAGADVLVAAEIVRLGRTMAFGRVTLTNAADGKPVATAQCAYALLAA